MGKYFKAVLYVLNFETAFQNQSFSQQYLVKWDSHTGIRMSAFQTKWIPKLWQGFTIKMF